MKNLEITRQITVLQSRRILYDELQGGTVNPFVRPKVEGTPVDIDDLTIESRVIPDEYEPSLDDPIIHIDTRKPVGAGLVTDYQASRFYEYFGEKNPLPDGYFYFNETSIVDPAEMDTVDFDSAGNVLPHADSVDGTVSKHIILRSLYAETLQKSTSKLTLEERAASVRTVNGYTIKEHFDVSMVRKTPENLVLLEDEHFLKDFNIDVDKFKTEEAERLELLIMDTADSAKARPINKHVAFFKKPHEAREDVENFIKNKTVTMRLEKAADARGESYFWRFVS